MASSISTFIVHKDNISISANELRSLDFVVSERTTGFLLISEFSHKQSLLSSINYANSLKSFNYYNDDNDDDNDDDCNNYDESTKNKISSYLKKDTPPLMYFDYSSFGGFDDDFEVVFFSDVIQKYTDFSSIDKAFFSFYDLNGFYKSITFPRYMNECYSDFQQNELELLSEQLNEKYFQDWKNILIKKFGTINNIEDLVSVLIKVVPCNEYKCSIDASNFERLRLELLD